MYIYKRKHGAESEKGEPTRNRRMSNSRIIHSLFESSWRPFLGFAASSFSTSWRSALPLPTALNSSASSCSSRFVVSYSLQLEPTSSFSSSFTRRLLSSSSGTAFTRNKHQNQQEEEDLFLYDNTTDDDEEASDGWEEEDDMIGDGGDGGGVVLQGVPWGESVLSIALDVLKEFDDDIKIFAFKTSSRGYIYVRLDKLSNEYGCPSMDVLENYSQEYKKRLDEAGERREIPDDLALEVSSPGAERLLKVPDDLDRFKDMSMRVCYIEDAESNCSEKSGVFILDSIDTEEEKCVWKLADVKENRDPNSNGRPFSRKQRDWRLELSFNKHRMIMLYLDY